MNITGSISTIIICLRTSNQGKFYDMLLQGDEQNKNGPLSPGDEIVQFWKLKVFGVLLAHTVIMQYGYSRHSLILNT